MEDDSLHCVAYGWPAPETQILIWPLISITGNFSSIRIGAIGVLSYLYIPGISISDSKQVHVVRRSV